MALDAAEKKTILTEYGVHESDTGSPEAQVALLTKRIVGLKGVTSGEWFCCLTSGSRINCRFRCSECNCPAGSCNNPACHCFTDLPMPCAPRLHSGDQPCLCPAEAPIPSLT